MNDSNTGDIHPERPTLPSAHHFPIVGIGASAGGLQALIGFFSTLPAQSGMAFVVVMHLSPTHESDAVEILQRSTPMPVTEVGDATPILPNHVYVIAPAQHLEMNDGYLRVSDRSPGPRGRPVAVDRFFRTLGAAHREHAFGIILSGTGSDGSAGLAAIKHHGGVVIVQDPEEAEFAGMARAAIDLGVVDFVLPLEEMGPKLLTLRDNAELIRLPVEHLGDPDEPDVPPVDPASQPANEEALREILTTLRLRTGHDFTKYKRATVLRRIERRLQVRERTDLVEYRDLLRDDRAESAALLRDMLIGVTQFFRDSEVFEALERDIVPRLFVNRPQDEQIRAWCVACATGEEAYTLGMLLAERAVTLPNAPEFQVFASDIDERAIALARAGLYGPGIADDMSPGRLSEHFNKEDGRFRIKKSIRDRILFANQNVLRDPPFSKLDLISCRNLLIYLNRESHAQVLEMFHFALKPDGFLVLGTSESADTVADFFVPVDKKNRIYQSKNAARFVRSSIPLGVTMPLGGTNSAPERAIAPKPSFAAVHQRVLADYAPPSVLINQHGDIVHMSDGMGIFLRHVAGEPSRNLVSLVEPQLRLELRAALFQAAQSGKSVETRRIRLDNQGRAFFVNMTVRPCYDATTGTDFVLVLFDKVEQITEEHVITPDGVEQDAVLSGLEQELQRARAQLQETIEHSETSNEELKASNEELQAINEELRSATEELETSKEELQSVNEELTTVNFELKAKVEETSKVNDDLQNLIASTDLATIFVDRGMRIKRYTPQAANLFNLIPSDVGRPLHDITHKLDYPELAQDAATSFESLRAVEREIRSLDERWFIARVLPYRTVHDRIDGAVLTFIDISKRRQAEERVRASEERMRLVAASTKDYAIMTTDKEGCITSFNSGAERIFGYTEEEVLGQPDAIIFTEEDRAAGIPDMEKQRARDDGRAEDERWHLRKDGSRFFCSGVMTPLRNGDFYGYAKIARDLTGRMELERRHADRLEQEQNERERAQSASAQKDEFLAIMSHELKHPLNLIHMNAELLMRMPAVRTNPQAAKAVTTIRNSSIGQAKIINDLLDLSRARTGKMELARSEVDLVEAVDTIADVLFGDKNGPQLTIDRATPAVPVYADPVRVEQIIWNLLSNAVKFTPPDGQVHVRIGIEGSMGRLQVQDTGQGIRPEHLGTIFDIFGQGTASIVRGTKGLGIGLAMVRQIVELHGGKVHATSDGPGKGACFTVWLPLPSEPASQPGIVSDQAALPLDGREILIVDDSDEGLEAFQMLLQMAGANVTSTSRAREALALLGERRFDVLVSDLAMPEMDGYTLIGEVRKLPGCERLPAVAMTGLGRQVDIDRALAAGFTTHLSKPIDFDELVARILQVLG